MGGRKVKPAIWAGEASCSSWGWVSLLELAEIIGQSSAETWDHFFGLSKDYCYGILAWSPDLVSLVQDGTIPDSFEDVFVPAGWAQSVLAAHAAEFVRVEMERFSEGDAIPRGMILSHYDDDGFIAVMGVRA